MNAVTYEMTEGVISLEGKLYTTYGIAARIPNDVDNACITIVEIPDISTDAAQVEALIERCNRLALSPAHLNEVVEDFLLV